MVLSENTEEGLSISSLSMVAIVKEILQEGAAYVLGRRVNQGPSEAYFGQQRSKGFRNENPTAVIRQQCKNFRRCEAQR